MRPAGHAAIGQKIEGPVLRLDQDEPHAVVAIDARQLDRGIGACAGGRRPRRA